MFKHNLNNGFTLIELLVVVLIIGILSAVAISQYQIAVAKSKVTQLQTLATAIVNAQNLYYLANGEYTTGITEADKLDIELPAGGTPYRNTMIYPDFTIWWTDRMVQAELYKPHIQYQHHYRGERSCVAFKNDWNQAVRLCKALGANVTNDTEPSSDYRSFQFLNI